MREKTTLDEYFCNPKNVSDRPIFVNNDYGRKYTPEEFYSMAEPIQKRCYIIMKKIECVDGFSMSVQAMDGSYCSPRTTHRSKHVNIYSEYEIGYPTEKEESIMEYCQDETKPTDTVYGYVPKKIIEDIIVKHGGIKTS